MCCVLYRSRNSIRQELVRLEQPVFENAALELECSNGIAVLKGQEGWSASFGEQRW
jgi:hypothetical protein